jgi:RimJ/RimL family protein N-acetyltransferase
MIIFGDKIQLRDKLPQDARLDYQWETDPEIARLDARTALRLNFNEYQRQHLAAISAPLPGSRLFAIIAPDDNHIGNCMYYRVKNSAETSRGIIIGNRDYWRHGYGRDAVLTLSRHVFATLTISQVGLRTLDWNERALRCFGKCGFTVVNHRDMKGQRFTFMELTRQDFREQLETTLAV